MKKTYSVDYLKNELGLPYENVIKDNIIDNSRWSIIHEIIFSDNGKFYRTTYSVGATECQDESPWEYETSVECTEVELKEVTVRKWVDVNN